MNSEEIGVIDFPAKFYKYRSMAGKAAEWVKRTVLHDEIYFAPASSFNDPFDLRSVFTLQASPEKQREDFLRLSRKFEPHLSEQDRAAMADEVMASSMSADEIGATTSSIQVVINQVVTSSVGVYCVSTKRDDLLMWAHYADSHTGICLEFDGARPLMTLAQKVNYVQERVPINPYTDSQPVMAEKSLLTKAKQWEYESEWRLLRYMGGPGTAQFKPANLIGIVIGANASRKTIETVKAWARARSTPIAVSRAFPSSKHFTLDIAPI